MRLPFVGLLAGAIFGVWLALTDHGSAHSAALWFTASTTVGFFLCKGVDALVRRVQIIRGERTFVRYADFREDEEPVDYGSYVE